MRLGISSLLLMIMAIFILAVINSSEEELPSTGFFIETVLLAIVAPSIASLIFILVSRKQGKFNKTFYITSLVSCIIGLLAYSNYAINGKSDSLHSASHMHVIMFPIMYIVLTFFMLIAATIIAFTICKMTQNTNNQPIQ